MEKEKPPPVGPAWHRLSRHAPRPYWLTGAVVSGRRVPRADKTRRARPRRSEVLRLVRTPWSPRVSASSPPSHACTGRRRSRLPPFPAQAAERRAGAPPSSVAFLRFPHRCSSRGSLAAAVPPVFAAAVYSEQCVGDDPLLSSTALAPLAPLPRPFFLRAGPEPSPLSFSRRVTVELDCAKAAPLVRCLSPARAPVRTRRRSVRTESPLPLHAPPTAAARAELRRRVASLSPRERLAQGRCRRQCAAMQRQPKCPWAMQCASGPMPGFGPLAFNLFLFSE
jgi:hypothetical protein